MNKRRGEEKRAEFEGRHWKKRERNRDRRMPSCREERMGGAFLRLGRRGGQKKKGRRRSLVSSFFTGGGRQWQMATRTQSGEIISTAPPSTATERRPAGGERGGGRGGRGDGFHLLIFVLLHF